MLMICFAYIKKQRNHIQIYINIKQEEEEQVSLLDYLIVENKVAPSHK